MGRDQRLGGSAENRGTRGASHAPPARREFSKTARAVRGAGDVRKKARPPALEFNGGLLLVQDARYGVGERILVEGGLPEYERKAERYGAHEEKSHPAADFGIQYGRLSFGDHALRARAFSIAESIPCFPSP